MMKRMLAATLVLSMSAAAAPAQTAARIRGTVLSLDGASLRLKDGKGSDVTVELSPAFAVTALVPAKLSDVTPGSFIGAAAETGADGRLVAKEVHIFPEAMRGTGEGHRAFDLGPKSTMTNGTVGNQVKGASADTITVAFKSGERTIVVPSDAPVVTFVPGDRAMLVPGAHVIVQARTTDGGGFSADRVTVGKDGLVPPM